MSEHERPRTLDIWARLMRGHAAMGHALSAHLRGDDGLTVNQFATLLLLSQAEKHRMRRVDVADGLQLTRSGVSRLLDALEESGLVKKGTSRRDARITYAVLTDAGQKKLEHASRSHRAAIRAVFAERYSDHEVDTLIELLGRLDGVRAESRTDGSGPTESGHLR
jgi:DNA-binding MarR family transcriptional regulator